MAVLAVLCGYAGFGGRDFHARMVLGGAVGNLVDRIRFRAVVDFLDFYVGQWHWPAFNVADIGVTCGIALLALCWIVQILKEGKSFSGTSSAKEE